MQADNADLSTNFNQNMITNQPNGGNDITYIAQTSPGAVMNVGGGYGNFSVYGLPATSNLFTVNGENDMDPYLNLNNSGATNLTLGRNDLQEATVISNAYSGQYGQQAGAQVNYVTKSGTNQYHGNAMYYWNGSSMNANDWFNNLHGALEAFRQQQPVGGLFRRTDQEGQTVLLRRHRRHPLHPACDPAGVRSDAQLRLRRAWQTSQPTIRLACRCIRSTTRSSRVPRATTRQPASELRRPGDWSGNCGCSG